MNTFSPVCSLAGNLLCGVDQYGRGTYTADGINALCEGLKGSAVTSLKCATAPNLHWPHTASSPAEQFRFSWTRPVAGGSLKQNNLNPEVGAALAEGLKGNTTLTSLK